METTDINHRVSPFDKEMYATLYSELKKYKCTPLMFAKMKSMLNESPQDPKDIISNFVHVSQLRDQSPTAFVLQADGDSIFSTISSQISNLKDSISQVIKMLSRSANQIGSYITHKTIEQALGGYMRALEMLIDAGICLFSIAKHGMDSLSIVLVTFFIARHSLKGNFSKLFSKLFQRQTYVFQADEEENVHPVRIFTSLIKSWFGFKNLSSEKAGKYASSLRSQIGLFCDIPRFFGLIKDAFTNFFNYLFNPEMPKLLEEKVVAYIEKCRVVTELEVSGSLGIDKDMPNTLLALFDEGTELSKEIVLTKVNSSAVNQFNLAYSNIRILKSYVETLRGNLTTRQRPTIIWLTSEPGTGKSVLMNILAHNLYKNLKNTPYDTPVPDNLVVYPRNTLDNFWDGYKNQPVVFFDDPFQHAITDDVKRLLHEIIAIGNDAPYKLNMASLAGKLGMYMNSRYIFISSNKSVASVLGAYTIQDPKAIERRIDFEVIVSRNSSTKTLKDWQFEVRDGFSKVLSGQANYQDFLTMLINDQMVKGQTHAEFEALKNQDPFKLQMEEPTFLTEEEISKHEIEQLDFSRRFPAVGEELEERRKTEQPLFDKRKLVKIANSPICFIRHSNYASYHLHRSSTDDKVVPFKNEHIENSVKAIVGDVFFSLIHAYGYPIVCFEERYICSFETYVRLVSQNFLVSHGGEIITRIEERTALDLIRLLGILRRIDRKFNPVWQGHNYDLLSGVLEEICKKSSRSLFMKLGLLTRLSLFSLMRNRGQLFEILLARYVNSALLTTDVTENNYQLALDTALSHATAHLKTMTFDQMYEISVHFDFPWDEKLLPPRSAYVKHILSSILGVLGIVAASYATYKVFSMLTTTEEESTEEPVLKGELQGHYEMNFKHTRRQKIKRTNPTAKVEKKFIQQSQIAEDLLHIAAKNTCKLSVVVEGRTRSVRALFTNSRSFLTVAHVFGPDNSNIESVALQHPSWTVPKKLDLRSLSYYELGVDLYHFTISDLTFPEFKDIRSHFIDAKDLDKIGNIQTLMPYYDFKNKYQVFTTGYSNLKTDSIECDGSEDFTYELSQWISYSYPTEKGHCGSVYILDSEMFRGRFCAIHTAYNDLTRQALGQIVTREMLVNFTGQMEEICLYEICPLHDEQDGISDEPRVVVPAPAQTIKVLDRKHANFMPTKTSLRQNTAFFELFQKEERITTYLKPFVSPDTNELIDPLQVAVNKIGRPKNKWSQEDLTLADECCKEYFSRIKEGDFCDVFSDDVAINGLDKDFKPIRVDTSEGFIGIRNPSTGKRALLICTQCGKEKCECPNLRRKLSPLTEKLREKIEIARLTRSKIYFVFLDYLKDEVRPSAKANKGKTRLFSAGSTLLLFYARKYFGAFMRHFTQNPFEALSGLGINPHSKDWKHLFEKLFPNGDFSALPGDYEEWDASLFLELIMLIHKYINLWYLRTYNKMKSEGRPTPTPESFEEAQWFRMALAEAIYNAYHVCGNVLYFVSGQNPSGQPLTSQINSSCNVVVSMVSACKFFKSRSENPIVTPKNYFLFFNIITLGDDVCETTNLKEYTLFDKQAILGTLGFKFTPPDKSAVFKAPRYDYTEVDFLKRTFRPFNGNVFAPLDLKSVYGMVNWRSKNLSDLAAARAVYDTLLVEAFHYGREFYNQTQDKFLERFRTKFPGEELLSKSFDMMYDTYSKKGFQLQMEEEEPSSFARENTRRKKVTHFAPELQSKKRTNHKQFNRLQQTIDKRTQKALGVVPYQPNKQTPKNVDPFVPHVPKEKNTISKPLGRFVHKGPDGKDIVCKDANEYYKVGLELRANRHIDPFLITEEMKAEAYRPSKDDDVIFTREKQQPKPQIVANSGYLNESDLPPVEEESTYVFVPPKRQETKPKKTMLKTVSIQPVQLKEHHIPSFPVPQAVPIDIRKASDSIPTIAEAPRTTTKEPIRNFEIPKVDNKDRRSHIPKRPARTNMAHKNYHSLDSQEALLLRHFALLPAQLQELKSTIEKKSHGPCVTRTKALFSDTSFHFAPNNMAAYAKIHKIRFAYTYEKPTAQIPVPHCILTTQDAEKKGRIFISFDIDDKNARKLAAYSFLKSIGLEHKSNWSHLEKDRPKFEGQSQSENASSEIISDLKPTTSILENKDVVTNDVAIKGEVWKRLDPVLMDQTPHALLERQIEGATLVYSSGDTTFTEVYNALIPKLVFDNAEVLALLKYFEYWSFDLEVEIRTNANQMVYGAYLWQWIPSYNVANNFFPSKTTANLYNRTPYNVIQDISSMKVVRMKIPMLSPFGGYRPYSTSTENTSINGTLACVCLAPLKENNAAGAVSVSSTLFWRLTNLRGRGFRTQADEEEREAVQKGKGGALSSTLETAGVISASLSDLPYIGKYAQGASALSKLASSVFRHFGYSMTRTEEAPMLLQQMPTSVTSIHNGQVNHQIFAMSQTSKIGDSNVIDFEPIDYNLFDNYKRIPGHIGVFTISPLDTNWATIATFDVHPAWAQTPARTTPSAVLAHLSTLWRGGMDYLIYIPCSKFTTMRLRIIWLPEPSATVPTPANVNKATSMLVDVSGPTYIKFSVPYNQARYMQRCDELAGAGITYNGRIVIKLVNQSSIFGSVLQDTNMHIWSACGHDMVFSLPRNFGKKPSDPSVMGIIGPAFELQMNDDPMEIDITPIKYLEKFEYVERKRQLSPEYPPLSKRFRLQSEDENPDTLIRTFQSRFPPMLPSSDVVLDRVTVSDYITSFTEYFSKPLYWKTLLTTTGTTKTAYIDLWALFNGVSTSPLAPLLSSFAVHRGSLRVTIIPVENAKTARFFVTGVNIGQSTGGSPFSPQGTVMTDFITRQPIEVQVPYFRQYLYYTPGYPSFLQDQPLGVNVTALDDDTTNTAAIAFMVLISVGDDFRCSLPNGVPSYA